ncbi:MAG: DUF4278 domain-containing protein [Acaryochloris sp. RU_4_1]|nr:DUF4278 domain-containing protein [Acaryochloris sp. SU_5_25]NJM65272.1 DUF4278 domain-containing protein [Acaryochloris sp. RU_4_1]NJR54836.1 DUF4278 domain-containing protein [Acaryochloris sp. CRU_2_0]
MKLKYRGVDYEYTPPQVNAQLTDQVGQYRGLEWRFRNPQKTPVLQPTLDLVYRGIAYQTGQTESIPAPAYTPPLTVPVTHIAELKIQNMARSLMMSHHKWIKNRQQSLLSRVATEVGLGTEAAHYWNHIQGKVHPSFRNDYDRSGAALS